MKEFEIVNDYKKPNTGITIVSIVAIITFIFYLCSDDPVTWGSVWSCIGVGLMIVGVLKAITSLLTMDCPYRV